MLWRDLLPHLEHLRFCPHAGKRERTEPSKAPPQWREKKPSFTLPFCPELYEVQPLAGAGTAAAAQQLCPTAASMDTSPPCVLQSPVLSQLPPVLRARPWAAKDRVALQVLQRVEGMLPFCPKDPQGQLRHPGNLHPPVSPAPGPLLQQQCPSLLLARRYTRCHWDPSLYSRQQAHAPSLQVWDAASLQVGLYFQNDWQVGRLFIGVLVICLYSEKYQSSLLFFFLIRLFFVLLGCRSFVCLILYLFWTLIPCQTSFADLSAFL